MNNPIAPGQRYKKLPKNALSWMVIGIAMLMVGLLAYRYRENPNGTRAARAEKVDQQRVEEEKPGDPEAMRQALDNASKKARDKIKDERSQAATTSAAPTYGNSSGDYPVRSGLPGGLPAGTPPQGVPSFRMPADAVDRYEAAKNAASTNQTGAVSGRLGVYEADEETGRKTANASSAPSSGDPEIDQRLQQLREQARQAADRPASGGAEQSIQRLLAMATAAAGANGQSTPKTTTTGQEWMTRSGENDNGAPNVAKPALSPYTLYEGTRIPCVMLWSINTEQPGDVGCQVTEPVYDTVTQSILLIPRFARLYGPYNSDMSNGQARIMVAFRRLIFPSGASVSLGGGAGAAGTDPSGRAGLSANVNNHFWQMFGSSFLIASVAKLASRNETPSGTSISINSGTNSLSGAAGQILVDLAKKTLERNTNVRPTADKEKGDLIMVYVNRDLILPPTITQPNSKGAR